MLAHASNQKFQNFIGQNTQSLQTNVLYLNICRRVRIKSNSLSWNFIKSDYNSLRSGRIGILSVLYNSFFKWYILAFPRGDVIGWCPGEGCKSALPQNELFFEIKVWSSAYWFILGRFEGIETNTRFYLCKTVWESNCYAAIWTYCVCGQHKMIAFHDYINFLLIGKFRVDSTEADWNPLKQEIDVFRSWTHMQNLCW